jgi:hypothetical protein
VRIPARFNGPPDSAHGGYTCGLLAGQLGDGAVRVSLRAPPPLERDLALVRVDGRVELRDGERVVAEGAFAGLDLELPSPVDPGVAAKASRDGCQRWAAAHATPTCFGCGPARRPGDGLRLFPGPIADGLFAVGWTPVPALASADGIVASEYVWAALDCPTSAPIAPPGGPMSLLAELHGSVDRPVVAGAPYAIVSWKIGVDGPRKRTAGCAIFDAEGRAVARSRALWIELRA